MKRDEFFPHVNFFLETLNVTPAQLLSHREIPIGADLLRALIERIVRTLPFSLDYYRETYPELADQYEAGEIPDLHQDFIERGYFQGRLGMPMTFDETYYLAMNPDVAEAISSGDVDSALEHYMSSGITEGRLPSAEFSDIGDEIEHWNDLFAAESRRRSASLGGEER
jgi:hypothetical protein